MVIIVIIITLSIFLLYLRNKSNNRRIGELKNFLKEITAGNFPTLSPERQHDDLAELRRLLLEMRAKAILDHRELEENYYKLQLSKMTLEEKYAQAYTLQLIQEEISREIDSDKLLSKALNILLGVFGSTRCLFYLLHDDQLILKVKSGFSPDLDLPREIRLDSGHMFSKACIEKGICRDMVRPNGATAYDSLIIPLMGRQDCLGVMVMENEAACMEDPDIVNFSKLVAQELGYSLENAYLYDKLRKIAEHDGLTEAYTRIHLMNYMDDIFSKKPETVSLIMFDFDLFKEINDKFGHLVGDMVLKASVKLIEGMLFTGILARYGGEEFVIVLPEVEPEKAYELAESIRKAIAGHQFEVDNGLKVSVTISAGLASYPKSSDSYEVLLQLADEALYRAKNTGRNKICPAEST